MSPFPSRLAPLLLLALLAALAACGESQEAEEIGEPLSTNLLRLTSPAFGEGETIPTRYTCDGEDVPPPLTWEDVPTGVNAYALIMDDPDAPAGTWVHWVLYDVPATVRELPDGEAAPAGTQGQNSWDEPGYGGPCPPSGEHRYFFKLYALDGELGLAPGADKETVLDAMQGHVLAQGQLMGVYAR
jgi:Raf kinase inhibitor-like YbhB/YbcL family protein